MSRRFRIIAHRGASAHAPENTLAAFDRAIALGAKEIELDVRLSSDGVVVAFHDDRLDEKTSLEGRVRHYDARTLERLDLLPWFRDRVRSRGVEGVRAEEADEPIEGPTHVPRLETIFERLGARVRYHIELKGWDDLLPLAVMRAIDAFGLRDHVALTSFSRRPLLEVRKLDAEVPITFLLRDAADALRSSEFRPELEGRTLPEVHAYWIDEAAQSGFDWVGIRAADLHPGAVEHAKRRGLEIRCWGIEEATHLRRAVELGAIGATVDWPGRAQALFDEWGRAGPADAWQEEASSSRRSFENES